jgi:hypothetical protein
VTTVAAAAGFAAAGLIPARPESPSSDSAPAVTMPPAVLPAADAAGEDLLGLPRFPGSVRTAFHREVQGGALVTDVEYVADAELDDVRGFYRVTFRQYGWEVIELDFSLTQWVFLVSMGQDVALVAFEAQAATVTIEIELEQPQPVPTAVPQPSAPTAPVVPPPPPPPPPVGDDDAYDGDD